MKRLALALLLMLPSASAQQTYTVQCNDSYCIVPIQMLDRLMRTSEMVEQAVELCGWK